jgi:hypothetical protein
MEAHNYQASIAQLIERSSRLIKESNRIEQAGRRTSQQIDELPERSDAAMARGDWLKRRWSDHGNLSIAATPQPQPRMRPWCGVRGTVLPSIRALRLVLE